MMRFVQLAIACSMIAAPALPLAAANEAPAPRTAAASCSHDAAGSELCFALLNSDAMIGVGISGGRTIHPYYILIRHDDAWSISARSTRRTVAEDGLPDWETLETRTISRPVDARAAHALIAMLTPDIRSRLDATPFYPEGSICLDGGALTVMSNLPGIAGEWRRHSCHSSTPLDDIAAALRSLAISVDPALARFER